MCSAYRIKFYYSSKDKPGEQYPCDINACREKIRKLKGPRVAAEAIDVADVEDVFRFYHAALTGPPAVVRAVFGMKVALEADFGRRTPALLIYGDPKDRYPTDASLGRTRPAGARWMRKRPKLIH